MSRMNCKIPASLLVRVTYSNTTVEDIPKILPLELFFASREELRTMFWQLLVCVSAWMRTELRFDPRYTRKKAI